MGDGGREARSELLVGGQLAGLGEVEQRLLPSVDVVGHRERDPPGVGAEQALRQGHALLETLERLPGAPARGHDEALCIEHEDDLAALLDQPAAALGGDAQVLGRLADPVGTAGCPLHTVSIWRAS